MAFDLKLEGRLLLVAAKHCEQRSGSAALLQEKETVMKVDIYIIEGKQADSVHAALWHATMTQRCVDGLYSHPLLPTKI